MVRVLVAALLLAAFHALDWTPFRARERDAIAWLLGATGCEPVAFEYHGSPALAVGAKAYYYTPECTHLDLLMIVSPFVWVFGAALGTNMLRIGVLAAIILGGNLLPCWAAAFLGLHDVGKLYAHDLPDYIIWFVTVVGAVLLALRRDFRDGAIGWRSNPTVATS